ncbi:MAG: hypothetical protein WD749_08105 [Phycisphaerales bacterium]
MPRWIENPGFRPPPGGLAAEWARMRRDARPLPRPLVFLGGWRAPSWPIRILARRIRELVGADRAQVLPVSFAFTGSLQEAARRSVEEVRRRWPGEGEGTAEVDVVGVSMGGLVARLAAAPELWCRPAGPVRGEPGRPRPGPASPAAGLRIARLFTIATPHKGASIARWICPDRAARDMRAGCELVSRLNDRPRPYELVCYARLRDWWVGATNAAPPGEEPIWVDAWTLLSHNAVTMDKLIRTDLARRLRGEEPLGNPSRPPRD